MKRIIYIDFENVSTAGLNGILELSEKDHVKIFLGPKCSKLSLIEAEAILHCNATVELITNDQIGKNALDFIIMVHMGYDIARKSGKAFYIISKDKGYEPAIHEMQSMTGYPIERLQDIKEVLAKDAELNTGGLFGFLGRKAPHVENTTEHEVYEKGKRVGKAKRSTKGELEKKNEPEKKSEQPKKSPQKSSQRSTQPKKEEKTRKKDHAGNAASSENKRSREQRQDSVKNKEKRPENMNKNDKKPPENTNKNDKKPMQTTEVEHREQKDLTDLVVMENKQSSKKREPVNEAERALIERAIANCSDKESYHNYLMGELRDTSRATELYKMSRNHFLRIKNTEKAKNPQPKKQTAAPEIPEMKMSEEDNE